MNRRDFVGATGSIVAGLYALPSAAAAGEATIKRAVEEYYAAYRGLDAARYRACLTSDYVLLENGEVLDADADLASMTSRDGSYRRTDAFDYKLVKVQGDVAYSVYVLTSDIQDHQGPRHRVWLESMILRRSGTGWQTAVLHSTKVAQSGG